MKKRRGSGIDPAKRAEILDDWPEDGSVPEAGPPPVDAPPSDSPLAAALDVIASRADALRRAGVRRVQVGDVAVDLDPKIEAPARKKGANGTPSDPLDDPRSYPGGVVPHLPSMKELFGHGDED